MNLIITGLPGSGKTSIVNMLADHGFNKVVDITDRPKRNNELYKTDHIHVTSSRFDSLWEKSSLIGLRSFRVEGQDFRYAIRKDMWNDFFANDTKSIITLGPSVVLELLKGGYINKETTVILDMDVNATVCAERMENRGDPISEIKRRLHDDQLDIIDLYSYLNYNRISGQENFQPVLEAFSNIAISRWEKDPVEEVIKFLKGWLE